MDPILQKLIDTRVKAAQLFQQHYGAYFGLNQSTYRVLSSDSQGYIKLQDTKTGKTSTIDPTNYVYKSTGSTGPASGQQGGSGGGGFSFQSLLGLSSVVTPVLPFLKKGPSAPEKSMSWSTEPTSKNTPNAPFGGSSAPSSGPSQGPAGPVPPTPSTPGSWTAPPGSVSYALNPSGGVVYFSHSPTEPGISGPAQLPPGWAVGQNTITGQQILTFEKAGSTFAWDIPKGMTVNDFASGNLPTVKPGPNSWSVSDIFQGNPVPIKPSELGNGSLFYNQDNAASMPFKPAIPYIPLALPPQNAVLNQVLMGPSASPNAFWPVTDEFGQKFYVLSKPADFVALSGPMSQTDADRIFGGLVKSGYDAKAITQDMVRTSFYQEKLASLGQRIPADQLESLTSEANQKLWAVAEDEFLKSGREKFSDGEGNFVAPRATPNDVAKLWAEKSSAKVTADNQAWLNNEQKAFNRVELEKFAGSAAAAAGAGYGLFSSVFGMAKGGASFKGIAGGLGSLVGLGVSLHIMHSALVNTIDKSIGISFKSLASRLDSGSFGFLHLGSITKFLSSGPGIALIAGLVTLAAILMGKKEGDDQAAVEDLNQELDPVVYNDGGVVAAAGLAFALMGSSMSPHLPASFDFYPPQVQVNRALQKVAGGIPSPADRYSTVFTDVATDGTTRVIYLQADGVDASGKIREHVHMETLPKGVKFAGSGATGYIPFFITDSSGHRQSNQVAFDAINRQQKLLQSVPGLGTTAGQNAAGVAGGTLHPITQPDGSQ